jgi:hypothetical protein
MLRQGLSLVMKSYIFTFFGIFAYKTYNGVHPDHLWDLINTYISHLFISSVKLTFLQQLLLKELINIAYVSNWLAIGVAFVLSGGFIYWGILLQRAEHERGTKLKTIEDYKKQHKNQTAITIKNIPIVNDALRRHFLFLGTTGTGKTVLMKEFLQECRTLKARRFCLDIDDSFPDFFADEIHIDLNKNFNWDFFNDFTNDKDFESAAEVLIPASASDDMWVKAARTIFVSICMKVAATKTPTLKLVYTYCCETSPVDLKGKLKNTPADGLTGENPQDNRTFQSMMATLATYASRLRYCIAQDQKPFSIKSLFKNYLLNRFSNEDVKKLKTIQEKDFSQDTTLFAKIKEIQENGQEEISFSDTESRALKNILQKNAPELIEKLNDDRKGCLFSASQDNIATFKPLLALWFDSIIRNILSGKEIKGQEPHYFIVLDELASLGNIPSLPALAARGRKYGASILVGLQDIHQLGLIYREAAETLSANLSTKFLFRQGTHKNAEWAANVIGQEIKVEQRRTTSFGAHEHRDGVSLASADEKEYVLTPTELITLENKVVIVRQLHFDPVKVAF